jgi:putative membrane protein
MDELQTWRQPVSELLSNIPYCGTPPVPEELWQRWNLDPMLIGVLGILVYLHARSAIHATGAQIPSSKAKACFVAGWAALVLALVGPICALSVSLFSARVTQHMWLIFVAAPLLVLGSRQGFARTASPLLAAVSFAVSLWLWHVPAMYALTFTSDVAYWLMHLTLLGAAVLLWQAILVTAPERVLVRLGLAFSTLVHMGMLGALITLAPRVLYSPHVLTSPLWGLSPLADQQLGGSIMWVPAGTALVVACLTGVLNLLKASETDEPRPRQVTPTVELGP